MLTLKISQKRIETGAPDETDAIVALRRDFLMKAFSTASAQVAPTLLALSDPIAKELAPVAVYRRLNKETGRTSREQSPRMAAYLMGIFFHAGVGKALPEISQLSMNSQDVLSCFQKQDDRIEDVIIPLTGHNRSYFPCAYFMTGRTFYRLPTDTHAAMKACWTS